VSGFSGADVSLSGTAGATTAVVTGGPSIYNVAVSGMTTDGTVIATIPAGSNAPSAVGAQDTAGNGNQASTSTDNTVTFTTAVYDVRYQQPLDESTAAPATFVKNTGKNGRVIPVKVMVYRNGILQTTQIAAGISSVAYTMI
jgi:hypothetical protein